MTVPMIEPRPMRYQTENHLIDEDYYWVKSGVASWEAVKAALDSLKGPLWVNGHSTFHGVNDKVPENFAGDLKSSLVLLSIPELRIDVVTESGYEGRPGRRRVRAGFDQAGHHYSIVATDPEVEDVYFAKKNGQYEIGDAIVCFSLSELAYGHAFKLAAAIITKERCEGAV